MQQRFAEARRDSAARAVALANGKLNRKFLATRVAFEPDITACLSCWVYEELWHGEAFSRFLGEAGYRLAPDGERVWGDAPYPSRTTRNARIRRQLGGRGHLSHFATLAGSA